MQVLVMDDNQAVHDSLARSLRYSGDKMTTTTDDVEALARLIGHTPDAVIMDVVMPRLDGLEATHMLRQSGNDVPIPTLTARDAIGDRVDGLDAGTNDYMAKPFALDELLARLRALTRRSKLTPRNDSRVLVSGDMTLGSQHHGVTRTGQHISLTRTEFAPPQAFVENPRRMMKRSTLLNEMWGFELPATANSLEVYISYLRRKTKAGGLPRLIYTIRNVGYVLHETTPWSARSGFGPTRTSRGSSRASRSAPSWPC